MNLGLRGMLVFCSSVITFTAYNFYQNGIIEAPSNIQLLLVMTIVIYFGIYDLNKKIDKIARESA